MTTEPAARPRLFTRDDGRERVAFPLADGILSVLGAIGIQLGVTVVLMIALVVGGVLRITTKTPLNVADPKILAVEILSYAAAGWFVWARLRRAPHPVFGRLTRGDVRVILWGLVALIVVRVANGLLLVVTHQTKHVQSGFEHFTISANAPGGAALAIALTSLTAVVVAPFVEEMLFRGLLFGALAARTGVLAAGVIAAVIFGGAHFDLVLFPVLAALGFISALAYAASGNLWTSVSLHALNNLIGIAALIATNPGGH